MLCQSRGPGIPFFSLVLLFLIVNTVSGATKTWTNTAGGAWTTGTNWSPNGAPAANDDVIIPALSTTATAITAIPQITLNSLTFTGTGGCALGAATSGFTITLRTTWLVPAGYTVTIGRSSQRLCWTTSVTCNSTLSGYVAFDAGGSNRDFYVNGTLTINSSGMLYDPNPSPGSDFYATSTAVLRTQKPKGFWTTSVSGSAAIDFNVAICMGGAYSYAAGVDYEYFGTASQETGAGFSQNSPATLSVNLSAGQTLSITSAAVVSSGIYMMANNLVNLNSTTLTLGTSGASPGTLSYTDGLMFNGTFARWFGTTAITIPSASGLFPMGTSVGDDRPLWLGYSANLTTAGVVRVNHTGTYPAGLVVAGHNDASWGNTVVAVSNSFWTITTATIAFNGSTAALRYGGTGFGTNNLTDLNASLANAVAGTHGAATNASTTYEVNRSALSGANLITLPWRIGTRNGNASPLPVRLVDFSARQVPNAVELKWSTEVEYNHDHFVTERSEDAIHFTEVCTVPGSGTSALLHHYFCDDVSPVVGLSYYRLRMVDNRGSSEFSDLVSCQYQPSARTLYLYPNPSTGLVSVANTVDDDGDLQMEVRNLFGEIVYSSMNEHQADLGHLPAGTYFVQLQDGDYSSFDKLVIQ